MSDPQRVWFITGVSSGLGKSIARAALAAGDKVVGTTRTGKAEWADGKAALTLLPMELTDARSVTSAVTEAQALHGRIDVLVNNAGYGLLGAIEEASPEEADHVFAVNYLGPQRIVQAALPYLRAQRGGRIVNISSIAGVAPMAGSGLYAAAKFALRGMSEALAQELKPLGIHVTLVEPGAFRTDFLSPQSIRRSGKRLADYEATAGRNLDHLATIAGKQIGDPDRGAQAILAAVNASHPPLHLLLGSDAVRRTREHLAAFTAELDAWEHVSAGTDYPAA